MNNYDHQYISDLPSHPGETLLETIEFKGMSQAELAQRMGRPRKTINEIIKGKTAITPETALQLELVLGIPASFWNKREADYQDALARLQQKNKLEEWESWIENFPYRELINRQWIVNQKEPIEIVKSVLSFFGVVSPDQWQAMWKEKLNVAFRRSTAYITEDFAVAAWIRRAEVLAQDVECLPYDEAKFKRTLDKIKSLTSESPSPELYQKQITDLCRETGIAFVLVPKVDKTSVFGASQWISPHKALIVISLFHKTDDIFWFTFFHEAAHLLLHSKKEVYIDLNDDEGYSSSEIENQANEFARDFLIPNDDLIEFVQTRSLSKGEPFFDEADICNFAQYHGVAPSIVVGRLQHDGHMQRKFKNKFKTTIEWANDTEIYIKKFGEQCDY